MQVFSFLAQVLRDNRGATAVEYGLIVAMIVVVMIVALQSVATANTNMWQMVKDEITTPND